MVGTGKRVGATAAWMALAAAAGVLAADVPPDFAAAHARFLKGRELQRLHRNTPESRRELATALDGYEAAAVRHRGTPIGARALYLSGSALLFLDRPGDAIERWARVVREYPADGYARTARLRKADVEKNALRPADARRTVGEYLAAGGNAKDEELEKIRRALDVIGKPAPALRTTRWFNSEPLRLEALRRDVVLLYFWAAWCPNCLKEVDYLRDLEARFRPRGLRVIGLTHHSRGQDDARVETYLLDHGLRFPVAADDRGETSRQLAGESVPTVVLIDRDGIVRWHDHPAALSDGVITTLIEERPARRSGT